MNTYLLTTLLIPLILFGLSQLLTSIGVLLSSQLIEYRGRALASFIALILCAAYGTIASAALNVAGYGGLGQWTTARSFKWTMWALTGVEFVINDKYGGLKVRPGVFIGNHQTYVPQRCRLLSIHVR